MYISSCILNIINTCRWGIGSRFVSSIWFYPCWTISFINPSIHGGVDDGACIFRNFWLLPSPNPSRIMALSGRKLPVVRALTRLSWYVHLTGSELENICWKILLKSFWMSHMRAAVMSDWYLVCATNLEMHYSIVLMITVSLLTAGYLSGGPTMTYSNKLHCYKMDTTTSYLGAMCWNN